MLTSIHNQKVSSYAALEYEEIAAAAADNQTLFAQIYFTTNDTTNKALIEEREAAGAKALVWSVDSPGSPDRQRAARFSVGSAYVIFFLSISPSVSTRHTKN